MHLLPDAEDPEVLARVTITPACGLGPPEGDLLEFNEKRRTYRKRFFLREVDAATVKSLVEAARDEGAVLRPLLTVEERRRAAGLVAEGDAVQWADSRWRNELAVWMRPRRRGDGLPVPILTAPIVRAVERMFNMGGVSGPRIGV